MNYIVLEASKLSRGKYFYQNLKLFPHKEKLFPNYNKTKRKLYSGNAALANRIKKSPNDGEEEG